MKKCKPSEDVCLEHCLPLKGARYCEDGRDRCSHDFGERRETCFAEVRGERRAFVVRACLECGAWLPLGPSDEHASERIEIEIRLAELLAKTECFWEPCGANDEQFDLYVDIFAEETPPPQLRSPGPRSPIEMMVDRACGYRHKDETP